MKKKIIGAACAFALALSMSTVAFAANSFTNNTDADKDGIMDAVCTQAYKVYSTTGGTSATIVPSETLQFQVTPGSGNPSQATLVVGENNWVAITGATTDLTLTFDDYNKVGVYTFNVSEVNGSSQGATYDNSAVITVTALVSYDASGNLQVESFGVTKIQGATSKNDSITNAYKLGKLTVQKTVDGNLASDDAYFTIGVTLTADQGKTVNSAITVSGGSAAANAQTIAAGWTGSQTVTISLKAGETVTFDNIPDGVAYAVVEDSAHLLAAGATLNPNSDEDKEYTVEYTNGSGEIVADGDSRTVEAAAVVENTKATTVDTAAVLESMPFVVMLVVAGAGLVVFSLRRRQEY